MSFFSNRAAVYFEQKDYEGCIAEVSEFIASRRIGPSRFFSVTKYCKGNVQLLPRGTKMFSDHELVPYRELTSFFYSSKSPALPLEPCIMFLSDEQDPAYV